jgi:type IV pilus assembly protein PilV
MRISAAEPRGFSLVEVMVALIVMSVGLLGVAKMQAVALSNTTVSGSRSLAAIEASSLAATMHANRGYWGTLTVPPLITLQGSTVTPAVGPAFDCASVSCSPASMAAYDLQQWTAAAVQVLPADYVANIKCVFPTASPTNCSIQLSWVDKSVALNTNGKAAANSTVSVVNVPKYELYVEP